MNVAQICETVKNYFSVSRPPAKQLPRPLLACSLIKRPGLSTIVSTSNVIKTLNMMGIPTGPNPDGSPNLTVAVTYAVMKEVVRMLHFDAVVQLSTGPYSMNIQAGPFNGGNVNFMDETSNGAIV